MAVLGAMVNVSEDAEPEFRVFLQHLSLRHVVAEMHLYKIIVLQHVFKQGAYFLAPLDPRILFQNAMAFR
jgi:hypothetical protein